MEEAEYAHRLALMNRGKLIALDTPARLRRGLDEPIFELQVDDAPKAVEVLRGAPGVLEAAMVGRALHVTVDDARRARLELPPLLAEAGHPVRGLREVVPPLEDVFVSRVRAAGGAVID